MHLLIFHIIRVQFVSSFSILISAKDTAVLAQRATPINIPESVCNCRNLRENIAFFAKSFFLLHNFFTFGMDVCSPFDSIW